MRVDFADQTVYENFVGHDVHMVSMDGSTDLATLEAWMDWRTPVGLETPSPATFIGGLNEMPAGEHGYFTVTLEPGHYVLISETPEASAKGLLLEIDVE